MRNGTPVACDRASFASQSASGSSSLQRLFETSIARKTASSTGYAGPGVPATEDTNIGGNGVNGAPDRPAILRGGVLQRRLEQSYEAGREPTILVVPRRRRSTEARADPASADRPERPRSDEN